MTVYLRSFTFPDADAEWRFRMDEKKTCYTTMYPFGVLSALGVEQLSFAPITILYGGNGCGKTTALNVIAERLLLDRDAPYNRSNFFEDYVRLCSFQKDKTIPLGSRIITSDDVFNYMLDVRSLNQGIDRKKEELFEDYYEARHSALKISSLADYDALKKQNSARRKTMSSFVREQVQENVREQSNGESASWYFEQRLGMDALYLLDEPENSLSPEKQLALKSYLEESARYAGCQLIISTHSPFLLAIAGAKIYDLDARPARVRRWTELPAVRQTYEFFKKYKNEFEDDD